MPAFEVELGPASLSALRELADALRGFSFAPPPPEDFMTMKDFCARFHLGASTVKRRVAEGAVERSNCGGKTPRYRWAAGYGDREGGANGTD